MRTGTAGGGYVSAQSISYSYDKVDNVVARVDHLQGVAETYTHDRLNRLSSYHVASSSDAGANRDVVTAYNAIGNVLSHKFRPATPPACWWMRTETRHRPRPCVRSPHISSKRRHAMPREM